MSSEATPLAPPRPPGIAARLAAYSIGGACGAFLAGGLALLLKLYYLDFLGSHLSLTEYLELFSPLGPRFWAFVGGKIGTLVLLAPFGAFLGLLTGSMGSIWRRWGEIRCCALIWASAAALLPLVLMLTGENTPNQSALMAPVPISVGMAYGAVLGLSARLMERWRAQYSTRTMRREFSHG